MASVSKHMLIISYITISQYSTRNSVVKILSLVCVTYRKRMNECFHKLFSFTQFILRTIIYVCL